MQSLLQPDALLHGDYEQLMSFRPHTFTQLIYFIGAKV